MVLRVIGNVEFNSIPVVTTPTLIEAITTAGLTANLQLALDAGDSNSYSGSGQKWLDTSVNGYDFFRGATSSPDADDPTFNGVAGELSSSEYWLFDGSQTFTYDSANETFMDDFHQDGAIGSMVGWIYPKSGAFNFLWLTGPGSTNQIWSSFAVDNNVKLCFKVADGVDPVSHTKTADNAMTADAWHFVGITISENGGDVSFFYRDGAPDEVGSASTFDAAYASPSASGSTSTLEIGGGGATLFNPNGSRISQFAVWSGSVITKANFDTLYDATKGRFGF